MTTNDTSAQKLSRKRKIIQIARSMLVEEQEEQQRLRALPTVVVKPTVFTGIMSYRKDNVVFDIIVCDSFRACVEQLMRLAELAESSATVNFTALRSMLLYGEHLIGSAANSRIAKGVLCEVTREVGAGLRKFNYKILCKPMMAFGAHSSEQQ